MLSNPSSKRSRSPSANFIITASIILSVIIGGAAILRGLGNAFYVTRNEFTNANLSYTKDKEHASGQVSSIRETLDRLEGTLSKEDTSLQKLVETVQELKLDIVRRNH